MKNPLNKIAVSARLLGMTHNVFEIACLTGTDGKLSIKKKQIVRSHAPYPCYSVSKSTVALALGLLYDKKLFTPQDKIARYLGEYFPADVDKKWHDVTIDHLLHHKPGTGSKEGFDAGNSDFDDGKMPWSGVETLTYLFSMPIIHTPGALFQYADSNYYILARLAEKLCGEDLMTFLAKNLFAPMGFINYAWTRDPNGHVMGGTGLMLRTEDYAKLGWLWLHKGVYDGVRYISEEWISMGLTASVNRENQAHYGYGVRRLNKDGYSITGAFGQGLYFNVNKNVVYAWHARARNQIMNLCETFDKLNLF